MCLSSLSARDETLREGQGRPAAVPKNVTEIESGMSAAFRGSRGGGGAGACCAVVGCLDCMQRVGLQRMKRSSSCLGLLKLERSERDRAG